MSGADARRVRLGRWLTRANDKLNGIEPAFMEGELGDPCDYARTYMGHRCKCGHSPITWAVVSAHSLALLREEWPK